MTRIWVIFRSIVVAAAAVSLGVLLTCTSGGCAAGGRDQPQTSAAHAPSGDDAEFKTGAQRPPTAKTLFSMARILETQGKDSQAEYILRKIVVQYPEFMPACCDLAETLLRQRRVEEAMQTLKAALARIPANAVIVNDLGMCQLLRNDPVAALEYFTRAAALAPDDARYRSNMAVALGMVGRYAEALALYRQVMPEADAHYNLGVLCESRHDKVRAAQEFQEAQAAKAPSASANADAAGQPERGGTAPPAPSAAFSSTTRPTE